MSRLPPPPPLTDHVEFTVQGSDYTALHIAATDRLMKFLSPDMAKRTTYEMEVSVMGELMSGEAVLWEARVSAWVKRRRESVAADQGGAE